MREKLERKSCSASEAALDAALLTDPKPRVLVARPPVVAFPGETSPPNNDVDEDVDADDDDAAAFDEEDEEDMKASALPTPTLWLPSLPIAPPKPTKGVPKGASPLIDPKVWKPPPAELNWCACNGEACEGDEGHVANGDPPPLLPPAPPTPPLLSQLLLL